MPDTTATAARRQVGPRTRFFVTMLLTLATSVVASLLTVNVAFDHHQRETLRRSSAGLTCAPETLASSDPCMARLKSRFRDPGTPAAPEANPTTPEKAALGERLFFEAQLSRSGRMSCATCHQPDLSWADDKPKAVGDSGMPMALRSPTLLNVGWTPTLGWDGKFPTLESVAFAAIQGHGNMNLDKAEALRRLGADPRYGAAYRQAFGDAGITEGRTADAIAAYERTLRSERTPFDAWISGDEGAIGEPAKRGFVAFNGAGRCAQCHSDWTLSDGSFHDIGSATGKDVGNGRYHPDDARLKYAFKVPTLREVDRRGAFMHDGSIPTLAAVIDLYDRGGIDRPSRSASIRPLNLTERQKTDLVAFLHTLTTQTKAEDRKATETAAR